MMETANWHESSMSVYVWFDKKWVFRFSLHCFRIQLCQIARKWQTNAAYLILVLRFTTELQKNFNMIPHNQKKC